MAGTQAGGRKAAAKNLARDPEFYKKIGREGGYISRGGGFQRGSNAAVEAGRKGGRISQRRKSHLGYA